MYYLLYKDAQGHWRWSLFAANRRNIANSGEWYHNRADCLHAINLVKSTSNAPVHESA